MEEVKVEPVDKKEKVDPLKEAEERFNGSTAEETIVPPASQVNFAISKKEETNKTETKIEEEDEKFSEEDINFQNQFLYDIGKAADFVGAGLNTVIYNKTHKNSYVELEDVRLSKDSLERKIANIPPRYKDKIIKSMPPWVWLTASIQAEYIENIIAHSKKKIHTIK